LGVGGIIVIILDVEIWGIGKGGINGRVGKGVGE
jgi:hypothetical protein